MLLEQTDSLILVIDIQEKLLRAVYNPAQIGKKAEIISGMSKLLDLPVIVTEQYPKGLGGTVDCVSKNLDEKPCVFEKTSFNAISEKDIAEAVRTSGKKQVIILGIETHICVYQTAAALLDEGYKVTVAADACSSRSEKEHEFGLDRMKSLGAELKTTEMILFELLKSSRHPKFKEIQSLIK